MSIFNIFFFGKIEFLAYWIWILNFEVRYAKRINLVTLRPSLQHKPQESSNLFTASASVVFMLDFLP